MSCEKWLEKYIQQNQPVKPTDVYDAGKLNGFTRREIKKARSWHGKYIDTETRGTTTLWRWNP